MPESHGLDGLAPWATDPSARPDDFEPFPPDEVEGSIPGRFFAVAERHGPRPAVFEGDRTTTYAEAASVVRRLARDLAERADGPRTPIALLTGHHTDQVLALLGILAAGRMAVVLDAEAPEDLNRSVIADAGARLVVHDHDRRAPATALVGEGGAVALDELGAGTEDDATPWAKVGPDDGALLAYTSGTTGAPKAALMPHRALLHLMRGATDALAISPSDRLPMLFPVSLAVAAYPMLLPLLAGAALCVYDLRAEGLARFPAWLADHGVSVIYFSPTVARFLSEAPPDRPLQALRLVVLGGERVDDEAVEIVRRAFGEHVVVANGYGATETGVLTFFFTEPGAVYGAAGVPVGRPIPGMGLEVLDLDGSAAPPGMLGELHVRSRYLFTGYWGRPEETARVLQDDDGIGRYRTGDLARLDGTGCLEVVGRSDAEVKVRGHRVVPGEVEAALLALDDVKDAVVEPRPDPLGGSVLVAWVVPAPEAGTIDATTVRSALARTVRAAFLPTHVEVVDELPLLPNGKLDRRALPGPGGRRPVSVSVPRDEVERELVGIWESVLGSSPIGVDEDFFELGGSSLDATRVLIVIEEERGTYVPMAALLDARTVEELADAVRWAEASTRSGRGRRSTVVPVQEGAPGVAPLFFVHDLYGTAWVLQHLAPLLGDERPVNGFESPLLSGPASAFPDLETLAFRYVTDLRLAQPEGPYHLAGYSFGGVLAFEMARQLVENGHEVGFLGVIDVGPGYRGRHYDPRRVLDKPWMFIGGPPDASNSWRDRLAYYRGMLARDPREGVQHLLLRTGLDRWTDPLLFRLDLWRRGRIHPGHRTWYSWRTHWELARRYRWEGRSYPGDLTLFWAEESASTDATMGWGGVVEGRLDVVRVKAPHESMMQPPAVERLAAVLRPALDQAAEGT